MDYGPLNNTLVIFSQWKGYDEKLCALEPCLRLEIILRLTGFKPGLLA